MDIGEGSLLCPFTCLTSNIKIGKFFHANIYSYVAHDCIIGDYVTFAPGVKCNGNIHIEDHAYIGTGAVIKQGTQQTFGHWQGCGSGYGCSRHQKRSTGCDRGRQSGADSRKNIFKF